MYKLQKGIILTEEGTQKVIDNKECIWTPIKIDRPRQDMIGYGQGGSPSSCPNFFVEEEDCESIQIQYGVLKQPKAVKIEKKNIIQYIVDWAINLFK